MIDKLLIKINWRRKMVFSLVSKLVFACNLRIVSYRCRNKKIVFVDCGANLGQAYEFFKPRYSQKSEFILIEPSPNCISILREKYREEVQILPYAVYSKNQKILPLYGLQLKKTGGKFGVGASLFPFHNNPRGENFSPSVMVKTISINYLLKKINTSRKFDAIVLKLDIEGSEYEVLQSIDLKYLSQIDHIFVEWHHKMWLKEKRNNYKELHRKINKRLKMNKIKVINYKYS